MLAKKMEWYLSITIVVILQKVVTLSVKTTKQSKDVMSIVRTKKNLPPCEAHSWYDFVSIVLIPSSIYLPAQI